MQCTDVSKQVLIPLLAILNIFLFLIWYSKKLMFVKCAKLYKIRSLDIVKRLGQGRPTQVGLWAADQLFSHILGHNLSKT
jgi:flagellar biogenesis protein FliO